jgi:TRAP-type C4-dicarboxylate transport system substrate-binding protein
VVNSDKSAIEQLEKAGIKVTTLSADGRARFKEASQGVYSTLLPKEQMQLFIDAAARNR